MSITLKQANTIIDAIIKRAAELDCRPISAVVVENGCIVKAFQKEVLAAESSSDASISGTTSASTVGVNG